MTEEKWNRVCAHHEAGHWFLALWSGFTPIRVSLKECEYLRPVDEELTAADASQLYQVVAAGPAATRLHLGRSCSYLWAWYLTGQADANKIGRLEALTGHKYTNAVQRKAAKILRNHWQYVTEMAERLLREREVIFTTRATVANCS